MSYDYNTHVRITQCALWEIQVTAGSIDRKRRHYYVDYKACTIGRNEHEAVQKIWGLQTGVLEILLGLATCTWNCPKVLSRLIELQFAAGSSQLLAFSAFLLFVHTKPPTLPYHSFCQLLSPNDSSIYYPSATRLEKSLLHIFRDRQHHVDASQPRRRG